MNASKNPVSAIAARFDAKIRDEAARRFGFDAGSLKQLDGTAFVYEGERQGRAAILKITPGLKNPGRILGTSLRELEAEVDYIRYLGKAGVPVALTLPSMAGVDVEEIPLDGEASFLAYCFEKAPGIMYPDEDEVSFPDGVVREWGRVFGLTHRLAALFTPRPGSFRLTWREDDCLDSRTLVPADQKLVHERYAQALAWLEAKPASPDVYGIVHGDLHHGNFLADGECLTLIDFDASRYFWFSGDVAIALFNCLPEPRSKTARRREFSLAFLSRLLQGYATEFRVSRSLIEDLPEFLFINELSAYCYRYKNWNREELARHGAYIASIRERIETHAPVVEFEAGDLPLLLRFSSP